MIMKESGKKIKIEASVWQGLENYEAHWEMLEGKENFPFSTYYY